MTESTFQKRLRERREQQEITVHKSGRLSQGTEHELFAETPAAEKPDLTTYQRKVRERREREAAEAAEKTAAEELARHREAEQKATHEERLRSHGFLNADGSVVGLEDCTNDTSWDERELDMRYYVSAVNGILDEMRGRVEGVRNVTLNECAFKIGQLSAGLNILPHEALIELRKIALATGMGKREVSSTMRSGFEGGMRKPRGRS